MSVLTYAVGIETSPDVRVPLATCTPADLAAAHALETRKIALHAQVELLLAGAAKHDLDVPDALRERISLWTGDLIELEALRYQLEGALLTPA